MRHRKQSLPLLSPLLVFCLLACGSSCHADGPADNDPNKVRPIPPEGVDIPEASLEVLSWRCKAIRTQWKSLLQKQKENSELEQLACEILVFPRAVELAIEFGQFYKPKDPELASQLLDEAARRIEIAGRGGRWADVVGLTDGETQQMIVGGFQSKIDRSYQPYGLVVPRGLGRSDLHPRRLDIWFHGRGEKLSEVSFLSKQRSDPGQYTPRDTIVLHPYGRYSNAFKFAGEIDVLEALDYVRSRMPVDPDRISVRGFSMGGAACWQFATHYADRWFAANPGAGFSESPEFLAFFQNENVRETSPAYRQTLWQLYDCPTWAINLAHCPTVAYSGELDRQKQAADVMDTALDKIGIDMVHVIGAKMGHKIDPQSKVEIESRMRALARASTGQAPNRIDFTTVTLRYHRMHWVDVRGMKQHWTPARVSASIEDSSINVTTSNVSRIRLSFGSGQWPGAAHGRIDVKIDGTKLEGPAVRSDRSWSWDLMLEDEQWQVATKSKTLRKRPGLQGPIDDAFMDSFLFVLPGGESSDESVETWVRNESLHAMLHWRKHFRGDIQMKLDRDLTNSDIASANLVLFGDPESNAIIRLLEASLPVQWSKDSIEIGKNQVPREGHVPAIIFPNPMNTNRYVVINSGFTFREYDYLNNARQTPKLPDWALIDVREGATTQVPGVIKSAGFFDETWQP